MTANSIINILFVGLHVVVKLVSVVSFFFLYKANLLLYTSINQSIKFISNQIKKFDIQCALYNIHGKLFYNKHVTTFSLSD